MGLSRTNGGLRPTATRVEDSTPPRVNSQIQRQTEATVAWAAAEPGGIDQRLRELDQEWDIERALQTNFSIVNLLSITLGALAARPWYLLTGIAAGFMTQHAIKGWCPPVSVLRRLGFRTAREIDQERYALRALRGDFRDLGPDQPRKAFQLCGTPP